MKKLKFLGTTLLVASLLFAGCSSPVEETDATVPGSGAEETGGGGTGGTGGTGTGGSGTGGSGTQNNYTAPELSNYYKNYLVSSPARESNKTIADWGAGSSAAPNGNGTWTITASESMWDGVPGVCIPFTGFSAGTFANYEYIVFTVDTTNFVLNNTDDGDGNNGVNVKIPDTQKDITSNYVANGNVRTYYAPISQFGSAPTTATEMAIIIGGTGSLVLNEVYLAATDDPNNRAITGITITPATASIAQGGSQQFTVKDSNHTNITSSATYALSGTAAEGSTITNAGLLTAGTTAGSLTVTATYTVNGSNFTASSTVTVLGDLNNLITNISFAKAHLAPGWSTILNNVTSIEETGGRVSIGETGISYNLPAGLNTQWQAQLKIATDADLAEGDAWYFSCRLSGVTGGYTIKLNDDESLIGEQTGTIAEGGSTVSFSGTVPEGGSKTDMPIMFDFGTCSEGTVVISDIVIAKTN